MALIYEENMLKDQDQSCDQEERPPVAKKQALKRFRGLAHSIIIWLRLYHFHSSQVRTVLRFFTNLNFAVLDNEVEDLMFSTSAFKPDKSPKLTVTALNALRKEPHARDKNDSKNIGLELRKFDAIAELPHETLRKLSEAAWFQEFEPLAVVIREGDFPLYYYFILSGSVMVTVIDKSNMESMEAKMVCTLEKGDTFGELAILEGNRRKSSVITREKTSLLILDSEDYKSIFMNGNVKILDDPLVRSNSCLFDFPIKAFRENPKEFVCSYFRPGTILVEDSKIFPWIFVIRSGSCRVVMEIKRLQMVIDEKKSIELDDKRKARRKRKKRKTSSAMIPHEVLLRRSMRKHLNSLSGTQKNSISSKMLLKELNIDIVENEADGQLDLIGREDTKHVRLPPIKGAYYQQVAPENPMKNRSKKEKTPKKESSSWWPLIFDAVPSQRVTYWRDDSTVQGKRTLATDLNKEFYYQKQRQFMKSEHTANTQFVTVQHLYPGMSFGLTDHFFEKQPSMKVISDGCDCFVFNKDFYLKHATDKTLLHIANSLRPFPEPEDVVNVKVSHIDWSKLRRQVMSDTLDTLARRHFDVNDSRLRLPSLSLD